MLQKVILMFLVCVLQFQFYHSRYVLIDVYDKNNGPRGKGCGDWCDSSYDCTGDPRCTRCVGRDPRWYYCANLGDTREHPNF